MTLGNRIRERAQTLGITQAEVARRAGVAQSTINTLINSNARTTPHLIKLARVLGTSPAYLMCESDDPDKDALPPLPVSPSQELMMRVAFPSEAALTEMFEAQLRVFGKLQGRELAHALAKRLPKGIARLQEVPLYEEADFDDASVEDAEHPARDHPEVRQARRK